MIVVEHRARLSVGQFRRQISTESCHRLVRSQGISVTTVIGFIAAADTGSSFFVLCLRDYAVPTTPPLHHSLFTVPSMRTSCLDHTGSHLCSYLRNYRSLGIPLHTESSEAC